MGVTQGLTQTSQHNLEIKIVLYQQRNCLFDLKETEKAGQDEKKIQRPSLLPFLPQAQGKDCFLLGFKYGPTSPV